MFVAVAGGCRSAKEEGSQRRVAVAAAADLEFALKDIVAAFERQHPDIKVTTTCGSSGNFFHQLSNQAPFDVFLSADVDYPRQLIDQGQAVKDSEFRYAVGHIVVWVPRASQLDLDKLGIRAVADPSVRKLAIANPRHAPYGRAAEAALKKLGLYDEVKARLVLGDNIAQAAQFVDSGSADAGIIALSLARAPTMRDKGRFVLVPPDAYPRLEQSGVILKWAADRDAARALCDFVRGKEGQAILEKYGFDSPEE